MPEHDDLQAVQELNDAYRLITERLAQVIVGQQQVIEELLVAMFARGHCLLVGVPGLAKTLLIRTLADALSLEFRRIQFTPDLMPSDITGTEVIQEDRSSRVPESLSSWITSVPVMSLGIRSGVNWMRLNCKFKASARVRIISVLASPGTPTSKACEPVRAQTNN